MGKKIVLFLLLTASILQAEAFLISNLPLPKTYVMNLDPYPCDEKCLQDYLQKNQIFSFLAHANEMSLQSKELQEQKNIYISIFNLESIGLNTGLRFALLLPYKKIGKYATTVTNTVFTYLMTRNGSFEIKSFTIDTENKEDIAKALTIIESQGFGYVIAPMTLKGAKNLVSLEPQMKVFFPTVNKNDCNTTNPNIFFGAIDYKAQSEALLRNASSTLVIFYDRSAIGKKLTAIEEGIFLRKDNENNATQEIVFDENRGEIVPKQVIKFAIASRTTNLEHQLKENDKLTDATIFLNTPLVKSGMILSQLTLYDINTTNTLSTQINYDPLIFSITQYEDRKDMIIANSITNRNKVFSETNALLGNDIRFDWINYATNVGIDYFFSLITNLPREYDIPMEENQLRYPIELVQPGVARFTKYEPLIEEPSE